MGEGIPKRHRLGYQKTKTPLHEPYMGIYVSGTPVRGGDRILYFTKVPGWFHSEDEGRRLARTNSLFIIADQNTLRTLLFVVGVFCFFFHGFINAHFKKTEPFRDGYISSQGGRLGFGVVNLFPPSAERDCHLNATFLERHERLLD